MYSIVLAMLFSLLMGGGVGRAGTPSSPGWGIPPSSPGQLHTPSSPGQEGGTLSSLDGGEGVPPSNP